MESENDKLVSWVAQTNGNVNLNATNKIEVEGRDLYLYELALAVALARPILIKDKLNLGIFQTNKISGTSSAIYSSNEKDNARNALWSLWSKPSSMTMDTMLIF